MSEKVDAYLGTPEFEHALAEGFDDDSREALRLAAELCTIPGISVPADLTDHLALARSRDLVRRYCAGKGLRVYERPVDAATPYPYLIVSFAENALDDAGFTEAVALIGHLDVVPPTVDGQFKPFLRGNDLYARGAADMKTVVATYLAWMGRVQQQQGPKPPFILMISFCEENGSCRPHHTLSATRWLRDELGVTIRFAAVGERTGELEWMGPELKVGPICVENRSWRWIRVEQSAARGLLELKRIAAAVASCRATITRLNEATGKTARAQSQPGLRSGFLTPFTFIAGEVHAACPPGTPWLTVSRGSGKSVHSAVADCSAPSLVERFDAVASTLLEHLGAGHVELASVTIGQDGNFNTYDGSGEMRLMFPEVTLESVARLIGTLEYPELDLHLHADGGEVSTMATVIGFDIRELFDHRTDVDSMLATCREALWGEEGFVSVNDCPPWRCPDDQPDLMKLRAAYEAVVGAPSPAPVKLHGNDGGHLVAWQQTVFEGLAEKGHGHAIVFGQVGSNPHGPLEFHRCTSIGPYIKILDRWAAGYVAVRTAEPGESD